MLVAQLRVGGGTDTELVISANGTWPAAEHRRHDLPACSALLAPEVTWAGVGQAPESGGASRPPAYNSRCPGEKNLRAYIIRVDRVETFDVRLDAVLGRVVQNRHLRQVPDLPASRLDPAAEIGLLGVHEEALVEAAGALERLAAGEHERPVVQSQSNSRS